MRKIEPEMPFGVEIINKERLIKRVVTAQYLAAVLFRPNVWQAYQQLEFSDQPFLALARESGFADNKSDEWARKYGFAEKSFAVYGSVADPEYIEVTPVVTGRLKRVGSGKEIELLPANIETAFILFDFHSEPAVASNELVIPSAYSRGKPGDLWVVSLMRAFYADEDLTIRPIIVLVRPGAKKALFVQEKEQRRGIDIAALEKFEATRFLTQGEVMKAIRGLGYHAALADFPFSDKGAIEKLLKPFEFKLAVKKEP